MREVVSIIQFGGAFTALLMAIAVFLVARRHDRNDILLAWILILIGIVLLRTGISVSGWLAHYPHQLGAFLPLTYLIGPLLLFYTRAKLLDQTFSLHRFRPHYLPMVCGYLLMVPVFLLPIEKKLAYIALMPQPGSMQRTFAEFAFSSSINLLQVFTVWLVLAAYAWASLRAISNAQTVSKLPENQQSSHWIYFLSLGLLIASVSVIISHLGVLFFNIIFLSPLLLAAYLCLVLVAGYVAVQLVLRPELLHSRVAKGSMTNPPQQAGLDQNEQHSPAKTPSESIKKYENSGLASKQAEALAIRLKRLMTEQALYRQHDLTLSSLAKRLGCPPKHLSQVLNEKLGVNFYEFINRYRVDAVKQQLIKGALANSPIIDLALNAGFNNKPAFYNAFRKNTGMTPTEYIKQQC